MNELLAAARPGSTFDAESMRAILDVGRVCNGLEDGMRIADEMLRRWIEEAGK